MLKVNTLKSFFISLSLRLGKSLRTIVSTKVVDFGKGGQGIITMSTEKTSFASI